MTLALLILAGTIQDARAPEPDAAGQRDALKLLRELYKDDYVRRSPVEQEALGRKLLAAGEGTRDDPTSQFVLLKEALDVAAGCADLSTLVAAADALGRDFRVDGPSLKLAALNRAVSAIREPGRLGQAAAAFAACAEQALSAEGFETASSALARAEAVARAARDAGLAAKVQDMKRELPGLKDEQKKAVAGDAEAAGRYLCFAKGDWSKGLPLLAQGKGPLRDLAERDLAGPAAPEKRAEIGEAWWEIAKKERSPWQQSRIAARARFWLDAALPGLGGLAKVRAEKRLEEIEAAQPGFVNLLRLVDPRKDVVHGGWTVQDGRLLSDAGRFSRIEIPYRPSSEYDLTVVFARVSGDSDVNLLLTHEGKSFVCILGGGGLTVGLGNCRGAWVDKPGNPTVTKLGASFQAGKPVTARVEVRRDRVRVLVDESLVLDWRTDYSDLSPNDAWKLRDEGLLGLGSYESSTAFHKVVMTEVTGTGKRAR